MPGVKETRDNQLLRNKPEIIKIITNYADNDKIS